MKSRLLVIKGKRRPLLWLPTPGRGIQPSETHGRGTSLPTMLLWHPDDWSRYATGLRKQNPHALRGVRALVIEL